MLPSEALVTSALLAASLTFVLLFILLGELLIRATRSRPRRGPIAPFPGRLLSVLREDYRGRRDPAAPIHRTAGGEERKPSPARGHGIIPAARSGAPPAP